jgi:hypothetical protein
MDHVISLLESQKGSPTVEPRPAETSYPDSRPALWPWSPDSHTSPESLEIPSRCNVSCRILRWPIFQDLNYDRSLDTLFEGRSDSVQQHNSRSQGIVEDDIPSYVHRFLTYVHTKNPVIDHNVLLQYAREAAENGLRWDGPTCVVVSGLVHFKHANLVMESPDRPV